jgi:hypothetical protein
VQARARFVVLALAAALVAGCGADEESDHPAPPPAPAPAPDGPPDYRQGGNPNGLMGAGVNLPAPKEEEEKAAPEAPKELELRVLLKERVVARGAPIPALIEIVNITKDPIRIVEGRADLARRTRFVFLRNGKDVSSAPALPAGNSAARDQDVTLASGQVLAAEVDLLPAFEETIGYLDGRFRFACTYVGDTSVVRSGTRGWNSDPSKRSRSKVFDIELKLPQWLVDLGADDHVFTDMTNAATTFQPGVPGAEKVASAVEQRGPGALGCLLLLTRNMGALDDQRAEMGRRAFALLRSVGEPALGALSRAAPGDDPAMQMTLSVLLADHDERSNLPPTGEVDQVLRTVAGGGTDAGMFQISFTGTSAIEPGSWLIDGQGIITLERGTGDDVVQTSIRLPLDLLVELKRALLASRVTSWRHVQRLEAIDEGSVSFSVFKGDEQIKNVVLAEKEALKGNPMSAKLIDAFRRIASEPKIPSELKTLKTSSEKPVPSEQDETK